MKTTRPLLEVMPAFLSGAVLALTLFVAALVYATVDALFLLTKSDEPRVTNDGLQVTS